MPGTNRLPALLALVATVAAVSGCGSNDISGEIPPDQASQLSGSLGAVENAIASGDCATASDEASAFVSGVNELPATPTGAELKDALRKAGENLERLVSVQCTTPQT